jgi:hypothetical protein
MEATMTLARDVRQAFSDWSVRHTGYMTDSLIANLHTPENGPPDVVVIVVDVNSELNAEQELRELREKVQRIVNRTLKNQRGSWCTRAMQSLRFDDGRLEMSS